MPTHYVSVARVYESANGNERELFTGSEISSVVYVETLIVGRLVNDYIEKDLEVTTA